MTCEQTTWLLVLMTVLIAFGTAIITCYFSSCHSHKEKTFLKVKELQDRTDKYLKQVFQNNC
jgi:hypothetical protein